VTYQFRERQYREQRWWVLGPPSGAIYLRRLQFAARGHISKLNTHYKNDTVIRHSALPVTGTAPRAAHKSVYNEGCVPVA
jgi:hypothetical protein